MLLVCKKETNSEKIATKGILTNCNLFAWQLKIPAHGVLPGLYKGQKNPVVLFKIISCVFLTGYSSVLLF